MLNKYKRQKILALVSIADWAKKEAEKAEKEEAKWLRTAASFFMKACDTHLVRLSDREIQLLLRAADHEEIVLEHKEKFKYKSLINAERLIADDIYDLADFALQHCWNCKENPENCRLREVLQKLEIPKIQEGVCEYAQSI